MTSQWKPRQWVMVTALALLGAGCSGINHTHSVSPASFLLPGLLQVEPRPEPLVPDSFGPTPGRVPGGITLPEPAEVNAIARLAWSSAAESNLEAEAVFLAVNSQ